MNMPQRNVVLARAIYRQVIRNASSVVGEASVTPRFSRLKQLQTKLGIEDGTPVYLKSGFKDKALYQFTFFTTLVGVGMSLETFYRLVVGNQ